MPAEPIPDDDWNTPGQVIREYDTRPAWPIWVVLLLIFAGGVMLILGMTLPGALVFTAGAALALVGRAS